MATLAAEDGPSGPERWLELLAPFPGRFGHAARLALICALTTLVVETYQTPEPALTIYIVFFLNKSDRATSVVANLLLVVVITLVLALVFGVALFVLDAPALRVASMALLSFGLLFLASSSKLRPLGAILALMTAYALDLLGSVQYGELALRALLYAWLFVAIPAAVSLVVNLLLAPSARGCVERIIAERLRAAAAYLSRPDADAQRAFRTALRAGVEAGDKQMKFALLERSADPEHLAALRQALGSSYEILWLVDAAHSAAAPLPEHFRSSLASVLLEMADIFATGRYPVDARIESTPASATGAQEQIVAALADRVANFATGAAPTGGPARPKKKAGFFLPDAFTNPAHIRYALKTTAAAMFCYALYMLLDWPGIHTCMITCYVVSLGTTGETVEKLTLRILGCLVGAALGLSAILLLLPELTSIWSLMWLVFAGALVAAWVAVGSPRISYAGFQIAFAFFLCVVQGASPAFDLTLARDRVIGVLLGNIVVYLLFSNFWPVSVADRIDRALRALPGKLAEIAGAQERSVRLRSAGALQRDLAQLQSDLDVVRYEPETLRPTDAWIDARARTIAAFDLVYAPLLLLGAQSPTAAAGVAQRIETLAEDQKAGPVLENAPTETDAPFADVVSKRLETLRACYLALETTWIGNAPA